MTLSALLGIFKLKAMMEPQLDLLNRGGLPQASTGMRDMMMNSSPTPHLDSSIQKLSQLDPKTTPSLETNVGNVFDFLGVANPLQK